MPYEPEPHEPSFAEPSRADEAAEDAAGTWEPDAPDHRPWAAAATGAAVLPDWLAEPLPEWPADDLEEPERRSRSLPRTPRLTPRPRRSPSHPGGSTSRHPCRPAVPDETPLTSGPIDEEPEIEPGAGEAEDDEPEPIGELPDWPRPRWRAGPRVPR